MKNNTMKNSSTSLSNNIDTVNDDNQNLPPEGSIKEFNQLCHTPSLTFSFETHTKFDSAEEFKTLSPIDLFIENTKELHKVRADEYSPVLGNLLLLGYVSASESYIRALIRNLVNNDSYIHTLISEKNVSYAAALHHKKELLPEALLEDFSLASPHNVFDTLKEIIGMKGPRPSEMVRCSLEFKKVCELRHCCVHRFGKLGSKNAVRLGLTENVENIERTIVLNESDIDQIAFIVDNFIRTLNNTIFKFIMLRSATNKNNDKNGEKFYAIDWTWEFEKDIDRYRKYYDIFSSQKDLAEKITLEESYNAFVLACKPQVPVRKNKQEKTKKSDSN